MIFKIFKFFSIRKVQNLRTGRRFQFLVFPN